MEEGAKEDLLLAMIYVPNSDTVVLIQYQQQVSCVYIRTLRHWSQYV